MSPTESHRAHAIPKRPTTKPLNTDVIAKATPLTVPINPFALAWPGSGTSRVTQVESAIIRRLPATAPLSTRSTKLQNRTLDSTSMVPSGERTNNALAATKAASVIELESNITRVFLCLSTKVPNTSPEIAESSMKEPPMIDVARTERVSR